jgi:hypothetical protein
VKTRAKEAAEPLAGGGDRQPGVWDEWTPVRAGEFDMALAESLVQQTLAEPIFVTQSRQKRKTLVFPGAFDEAHLLAVPLKALPCELWQETLYIRTIRKVLKSGCKPGELLYQR